MDDKRALEIAFRIAVTALADATALTIRAKDAGLLGEGFEELRAGLREGMLQRLRRAFEGEPEDLQQFLRDFEGPIQ